MEKYNVYLEALVFLSKEIYQKFLKLLNDSVFFFSFMAILFFTVTGFIMLNFEFLIFVLLFIIAIAIYREVPLVVNIAIQLAILMITFLVSFPLGLFYDYETIKETSVTITKPIYEVTKDDNIILQDGNPTTQISLGSTDFALIKNSKCSEIKKIKVYRNHKDFSDIYQSIVYKITCDGKEI